MSGKALMRLSLMRGLGTSYGKRCRELRFAGLSHPAIRSQLRWGSSSITAAFHRLSDLPGIGRPAPRKAAAGAQFVR